MIPKETGRPVRAMRIEPLEARQLLAVDLLANLDIDENTDFTPRDISSYNGQIIVRGNDGKVGPEAWITSGTPEDVQLLKDIRIGEFGSGPRDFVEFQGQLFFAANNGFNGYELWVTQGTKASTQLIADIWPGDESGVPTGMIEYQDALYFFANDGESGRELYRSDGTAFGTKRVADSVEGRGGADGANPMVIGNKLFFVSETENLLSGESGLWVSDGTAEGTQPLNHPGITTAAGPIGNLTDFDDRLVFTTNSNQLWISDGTVDGTQQIGPADATFGAAILEVATIRGLLYTASSNGLHLVSSDLTSATQISANADGVTSSDGDVYFWNDSGFYVVDANNQPEQLVKFNSFFGTKMGTTFSVEGGLLFNFNKTLDQYEIWVTDGTKAGTELVEKVKDTSSPALDGFQQIGDSIYFAATNGGFRDSLWKVPAPTIEVVVPPGIEGDVNDDFVVDTKDIDAVYAAVAASSSDPIFDLNDDNEVSESDATYLIEEILHTKQGDIDLNGRVDFIDFLAIAQNFGTDEGADWASGDMNGDGSVSFTDFLALAANFGFDAETLATSDE